MTLNDPRSQATLDAVMNPIQVTLSDDAWIDVVQDGKETRSASHVGLHGCPDLRKSVRFELKAAPAKVQIRGAPRASIKVGFAPAE